MKSTNKHSWSKLLMIFVFLHTVFFTAVSNAGMVTTTQALAIEQQQYDKEYLLNALNDEAVQTKLIALGVDTDLVSERVKHMTPSEIAYLNENIDNMEAGQGVVGILLLIFLVFIVTDMLCATNIFSFVKCINK
ncbi:PA2779 family protein [Litoribrevibacter albus]|uniref:PA2779 family protein n=1 Tax=Litoribrevibacter albus TaxID=1473156 RepID=A0AA37W4S7_9GAMM|nr:PA2779 family protein [Litoribrevibacter albus]GLQ29920.1 hypothetical protein GCM10007876_03980 [Litoribrevibacter albus]